MNQQASVRVEPSVELVFIPRCPRCLAANPKALSRCPDCNAPAPAVRRMSADAELAGRIPLLARLCFRIAAFLRRIAKQ